MKHVIFVLFTFTLTSTAQADMLSSFVRGLVHATLSAGTTMVVKAAVNAIESKPASHQPQARKDDPAATSIDPTASPFETPVQPNQDQLNADLAMNVEAAVLQKTSAHRDVLPGGQANLLHRNHAVIDAAAAQAFQMRQ